MGKWHLNEDFKDGASHRKSRWNSIAGRRNYKCQDIQAGGNLACLRNLRKNNRGKDMAGALSECTGQLVKGVKQGVAWSALGRCSLEN